ncbi:unnamed protein product [Rhizopus stolonifer]
MVQPNQKAYSPYYMTPAAYAEWSPHLQALAKSLKTEITFCFEEQYFDIRGRSQTACDDTMEKIVRKLLPELCDRIDDKLMMGTYEDIEDISETYSPSQPIVSSSSSPAASSPAVGRAPILDQDKNEVRKPEKRGAYYYNETESDGSDSEEEEFVETFSFAKNVRKPTDILNVPSVGGKKPIDYLTVIGNDTDTECSLVDKTVKIVGSNEASVKEAHQRFKNLQTIYKRSKRPTSVVSCVHIQSDEDCGIYFCHLDHFAHKAHIELLSMKDAPYFVLLPVFRDERGAYQKPKDLLEASRTAPLAARAQTPGIQQQQLMQKQKQKQQQQQQHHQHQQQQQQRQQQQIEISLEERMKQATFKTTYANAQYGMAPDQRPLWGENKNFVTNPSMQAPSPSSPRAPVNPPPIQAPKSVEDDFPALPTAPTKAPTKKKSAKRVMRIGSQKSGRGTPAVSSHVENRQKYNLHVMRTALAEGLESVRGYKGNIKLSASMGKVLWTRLQSDTQKIIWTYEKINDILIKEKGVQPTFNGLYIFKEKYTENSYVLGSPKTMIQLAKSQICLVQLTVIMATMKSMPGLATSPFFLSSPLYFT